jgi:hypothetical protein
MPITWSIHAPSLPHLQPVRPPAGREQAGAQPVELWLTTANSLERSRCGKSGAPLAKNAKLSHSMWIMPYMLKTTRNAAIAYNLRSEQLTWRFS